MARRPSGAALQRRLEEHKSLTEFARSARWWVWFVASVITVGFAWIQLQNSDLTALLSTLGADIIWRASLILYFTSWVMGLQFDIDVQEEVLISSGERSTMKREVVAFILGITALGTGLVWAVGDIARFSVALTIFLIVDHAAWRYLAGFMAGPYELAARHYEETDRICLEKLETVRALVFGGWKWWRLTVIVPLVLLMLADAFIPAVRTGLSDLARAIFSGIEGDADAMVGGVLAFIFVLGAELWIWLMRIRAKTKVSVLDDLGRRYQLKPIKLPTQ